MNFDRIKDLENRINSYLKETLKAEIDDMINKNKIHCVLVTDEDNRLIGVVDSFRLKL